MKTIDQPKPDGTKAQAKNADGGLPPLLVSAATRKTIVGTVAACSAVQSDSPLVARFGSTARSAPQRTVGAFNPALPEDGALILAGVLRDQFNGLVVMMETIPAGPPGPQGEQGIQGAQGNPGPPFAQAVIDSVSTLPAYEQAWVTSWFDGTNVHFSFGIPHGYEGSQGQQGVQGTQGPPFAQAVIDGVTTLDPGQPATVSCWFDGSNVHFTFGIPRGADGQQGPPGEVSTAQLNSAISGTALNPSGLSPLYITISDPPTQGEVQQMLDRMNQLITALYRAP